MVLVAATLLVGGCSSTVEGEAFPVDVIGMFDPCEVLSNEELEKVGVDPATKEVDIVDTHIDGFNICSWNGEWYFLSLTSTDHSLVEVEQNPVMRDLHRTQIAGREVLKYQERNDKTDSACNVAFETSQSTAMIRVGAKVLREAISRNGSLVAGLQQYAGLDVTPMDKKGLAHDLASFDGEPIYRGDALFGRWLNERTQSQAARNVTFFNLIALHDGNRYVASRQIAPYKARLKTLLDQLDDFMTTLEQSGRKVAVVVVPEHGAALAGDRMQMPGLRDIPSPSITQVPVGVALLGTKAPHEATRNVDTPSSFLAVSELVSRLVGKDVFGSETIDWDALLGDLPQTPSVSENQGSVVIEYQGKYHIKLGEGDWVPYPL